MSREIPEWVKVGQEGVLRYTGINSRYQDGIFKIAKIHKNGNFVLDGRDGQWRPFSNSAMRAGANNFSSELFQPLTDEVRARVLSEREARKARDIVLEESERLRKLSRSGSDDDEVIAEAKAIMSRGKP